MTTIPLFEEIAEDLGRWTHAARVEIWPRLEVGLKRLVDIAGAGLGLLLLSPVFIAVAAAIKLNDGGPVFFVQRRVGKGGRIIGFPKFRSMRTDAEQLRDRLLAANGHGDSITFKMRRDPRVTAVGRILRRFSIDELPQLWCVVRGDMSLVGPRPALPAEVDQYSYDARRRLSVTPGLTCTWQVAGRGDIPFEGQLRLDLDYIRRRGLVTDTSLLLKTLPAVLSGRGAY